jgi:iron complex transport system ATP-binding protein
MQKIIEIKNATVYRGQTCVFENFSLDLTEGQNTVILGPNGAGKSTLLKLLSRDLYPVAQAKSQAESYVRLYGQERWDVWELRSRFGIVSHDLQQQYVGNARGFNIILSGFYSSIDIAWHHTFSDDDTARAQKVLDLLGIGALQEKTYATMSTGEQRRFLLGRALINDPEALVLDEPTSGLDLQACFQYLATIRHLMQAGKTLALVTHHIHEIPPEVSRVVLLKQGRVIADGKKEEVLTNAQLSALFETPVELVQTNGFYQALPGTL